MSQTQPTPDQHAALCRFAEDYGRTWKQALRTCWEVGSYPDWTGDRQNDAAYLQQIRNQFGPDWLIRWRLHYPTASGLAPLTTRRKPDTDLPELRRLLRF